MHDGTDLEDVARDPLVGQQLDRYTVEEQLGEGGMGCVYRARHTVLDREYAIKVLFADFADDGRFLARFRREAQSMSRVRHPHIVNVEDFGTSSQGLTFLVMELVQGRTLEQIIADEAPLPPVRAARLMQQVLEGLGAAHQGGFVHRDVKPANIMVATVDGEEQVKLLDFGAVSLRSLPTNERLTYVGHIIGTPTYMAPEQSQDPNVGPPADLYAVGVVLYEMLTGQPPFTGAGRAEVMVKHISAQPPAAPPSAGLERLVQWLMRKLPSERPQSAEEVIGFLTELDLDAPDNEVTSLTPLGEGGFPSLNSSLDALPWSEAPLPMYEALDADTDEEDKAEETVEVEHETAPHKVDATHVVRERVVPLAVAEIAAPAQMYMDAPDRLAPEEDSDDGGPTQLDAPPEFMPLDPVNLTARPVIHGLEPNFDSGPSLTLAEDTELLPGDAEFSVPEHAVIPVPSSDYPSTQPEFNVYDVPTTESPVPAPIVRQAAPRPLTIPGSPAPRSGLPLPYYLVIAGLIAVIAFFGWTLWSAQQPVQLVPQAPSGQGE